MGCGADSFMIKDGICDELTNTKRCIYDGGDCCKADKLTHMCKMCLCKMEVDEHQLTEFYSSQHVKAFKNADDYHNIGLLHMMTIKVHILIHILNAAAVQLYNNKQLLSLLVCSESG